MKYGRALVLLSLVLSGCGAPTASEQHDIFLEDARNSDRRRAADPELRGWTISMGGCTGHLIAPELMMTASHCRPSAGAVYTSGASSNLGARGDIQVTRVLENSRSLDYAILQIRWRNGFPAGQKFPPLIATSRSSVQVSSAPGQGDHIFTVGFPGDKTSTWGATYSEGQLKSVQGDALLYNMGIINGNSGGGVWRKSDLMLVSLTNGGPRKLGAPGWNQGRLDDPGSWNKGAAMWNIYAASAVLKSVFPGGRNRFASELPVPNADVAWIRLHSSIGQGAVVDVSVPSNGAAVWACFGQRTCSADTPGATSLAFDSDYSGRRIFRSTAELPLVSGQDVWFAVAGSDGALIGSRHLRFMAR